MEEKTKEELIEIIRFLFYIGIDQDELNLLNGEDYEKYNQIEKLISNK